MNWRLLVGDVREQLATLPAESVQTCVTSPPYWGLRDYGTGRWEGGEESCDHRRADWSKISSGKTRNSCRPGRAEVPSPQFGRTCGKCGAQRIDNQIGLEATPDDFCAALVDVFREVRRVLKKDGTCWVNLGDTYLAQQGNGFNGQKRLDAANLNVKVKRPAGMKPKDLCGIPWMVAFALRADGWYLRSDIIWAKPNPMPESIKDRPTKAHEYIFLLSKSERYFYDAAAIAEQASCTDGTMRFSNANALARNLGNAGTGNEVKPSAAQPLRPDVRNARSVWSITTQPYPEAHFATFPEALPEKCILAGSRHGDVVLDPFTGSGTTGAVAIRLGREFVGCELNQAYAELARKRIGGAAPLFATEQPQAVAAVDPGLPLTGTD
jgi:DNA modification methylase